MKQSLKYTTKILIGVVLLTGINFFADLAFGSQIQPTRSIFENLGVTLRQ